jgi:hypothetical protein
MEALYHTIRTHLSGVHGLPSLRLQNHLYGCYLLLEDIVQKNVTLTGTTVQRQQTTFDLNKQFAEIGLRYGFAIDTQLLLTPCPPDYQAAWVHVFTTLTSLEEVDVLEEKVNRIIQELIPEDEGFFVHTAETGTLPPQWVDRALSLLLPISVATASVTAASATAVSVEPKKEDPVKPAMAVTVASLLEKHKDNPKRMFASTRRRKLMVASPKRILATTRRSTKPSV